MNAGTANAARWAFYAGLALDLSADTALWKVTVPANGEAVVTATFITRY